MDEELQLVSAVKELEHGTMCGADEVPQRRRPRWVPGGAVVRILALLGVGGGVALILNAQSHHSITPQAVAHGSTALNSEGTASPAKFHPVGPSIHWRPTQTNCVHKISCRNWNQWRLDGRLGNRLVSISSILDQAARMNLCWAWVQQDDADIAAQIIDFPDNMLFDIANPGVDQAETAPWGSRMCVSNGFNPYSTGPRVNQMMHDYFVHTGRLKCNASNVTERPELGPGGVVLHMRSGDLMRPVRPGYGVQPPCAFYEKVVGSGFNGTGFHHVLIVTEIDHGNPCIEFMQSAFPNRIKVQSRSVIEDACVIATAQNLAVAGFSSFDVGLTRLNVNLKHLFVPFGEDRGVQYATLPTWSHYPSWIVHEAGMPYAQHVYSFPGYNTWWGNYWAMRGAMTTYHWTQLINRTIPALSMTQMNDQIYGGTLSGGSNDSDLSASGWKPSSSVIA